MSKKRLGLIIRANFIIILAIFFVAPQAAYCYKFGDLQLNVRAAVSETYDDNITFAKTNRKKDTSTDLLAGLDALYEGKVTSISAQANIKQQFYNRYSTFNNISEDLSLNFAHELSKNDRFSLKDTFVHAEEPRSLEDEFGRTGGRYSYFRNRFNLEYARDILKQLMLKLSYRNFSDDYSRKDILDSRLNGAGARLEYALYSTTVMLLNYDYSKRKFKGASSATTNAILAGLRQYFTKQLYLEAFAGVSFLNSYDKTKYTRPSYSISLIDDVDINSTFRLTYNKEYQTNSYSQNLFDYWQTSLEWKRQLLQRLSMSLSGFYGEGKYLVVDTRDKLKGCRLGLAYDFLPDITLNVNYYYARTDSNDPTREYSRNTAILGFSAKF